MTDTYVRAGKVNWIAKGSDVGVQERTLAPGEVIPWHYHTIITDTTYCIEGTVQIEMLGRDLATVNLEFKVHGKDLIGRQSQTWVRFPDLGWKVIAAHVSTTNTAPLR